MICRMNGIYFKSQDPLTNLSHEGRGNGVSGSCGVMSRRMRTEVNRLHSFPASPSHGARPLSTPHGPHLSSCGFRRCLSPEIPGLGDNLLYPLTLWASHSSQGVFRGSFSLGSRKRLSRSDGSRPPSDRIDWKSWFRRAMVSSTSAEAVSICRFCRMIIG